MKFKLKTALTLGVIGICFASTAQAESAWQKTKSKTGTVYSIQDEQGNTLNITCNSNRELSDEERFETPDRFVYLKLKNGKNIETEFLIDDEPYYPPSEYNSADTGSRLAVSQADAFNEFIAALSTGKPIEIWVKNSEIDIQPSTKFTTIIPSKSSLSNAPGSYCDIEY